MAENYNEILQNRAIRRAMLLEGFKNKQAKEVLSYLNKDILPDLIEQLNARLAKIENFGFDRGKETTKRLETMINELAATTGRFVEIQKNIKPELQNLAKQEVDWQIGTMNNEAGISIGITQVSTPQLIAAVFAKPFDGRTLSEWFERLSESAQARLSQEIRRGVTEGLTTPQIVKRIRDDGYLAVTRAQTEAVVRSGVSHIANAARETLYDANADILKGVQWNATLDTRTCPSCAPLDGKIFKLKDGPRPPLHVNCLHPDSLISTSDGISAVSKRWFEGNIIIIKTASGNKLTCTPNHPIFRGDNFVAADSLVVGDNVFSNFGGNSAFSVGRDNYNRPTKIHKLFDSFLLQKDSLAFPVPLTTPDFHNEGEFSKIAVILTDGELLHGFKSPLIKKLFQHDFVFRNNTARFLANSYLFALSSRNKLFKCCFAATSSIMSSLNLLLSGSLRHSRPLQSLSLACCSNCNSVFSEYSPNDITGNPKSLSSRIFAIERVELDNAFRTDIGFFGHNFSDDLILKDKILQNPNFQRDKITSIESQEYKGFVYNLETTTGYYIADGIATHNCRCTVSPVTKSFKEMGINAKDLSPATRASMNGQVAGDLTYNDWLKKQSIETQNEALGKTRAALFRSGGLDVKQFVNQNRVQYTLDDLRKREAAAFRKAGL